MTLIKFRNDKHFEECVVQALIVDQPFAEQMVEVLDLEYFNLEHLKETVRIMFSNYKQHKVFPSLRLIWTIAKADYADNDLMRDQITNFLVKIKNNPLNGDLEYVKEQSLDFCKKRSLAIAMESSLDLIQEKKYEQIVGLIQKAILAGSERDIGHLFVEDFEKRMIVDERATVPTPWSEINDVTSGGLAPGELGVICAPTGCHAAGAKILMYDGTFKCVERVVVGDRLMGPDSTVRVVQRLISGIGDMYRIDPKKGESFVVNDEHTLRLKSTNERKKWGTTGEEYVEITVKDYLNKSKHWKHVYKLYRVPVDFHNQEDLEIHPYHFGMLLCDGCFRKNISFTTNDTELLSEAYALADTNNVRVYERGKLGTTAKDVFFRSINDKNILKEKIKSLGLFNKLSKDKSIPHKYKTSSRKSRLQLLAGLLDTDGHLNFKTFDFCVASKQLADDVGFVSRSLGFLTTQSIKFVDDVAYFRVFISGETSEIPTKLKRKQAEDRKHKKNPLVSGFDIELDGTYEYFGFTLDGDNLYLNDDFFVIRNCGKSHFLVDVGHHAASLGYNVAHYTFELGDIHVGRRYDARISGIAPEQLVEQRDVVKEAVDGLKGKIVIKSYPTKSATTLTIKNHLHMLVMRDFKPDLIVVDYGDLMRSQHKYDQKRLEEESVYEDLRGLAQELNIPIWTATQTNREGLDAEVITLKHIAECFGKAMISDLFITMNRKKEDGFGALGTMFVAKSRLGPDGMKYPILINTSLSKIQVMASDALDDDGDFSSSPQDLLKKRFREIQKNGGPKNDS